MSDSMKTKDVLLLLTDRWADWEAAYAIAEVNSVPQYQVKTIAADRRPKVSIGGLRAEIDLTLGEYRDFEKLAMLILPGGFAWQERPHEEIAAFVRRVAGVGIPVAAICGATIFLGRHGFLDGVAHTGDDLELFEAHKGYRGRNFYESAQVATEGGFITANETAAVDFAYEIFKTLAIDTMEELDAWREKFGKGMTR